MEIVTTRGVVLTPGDGPLLTVSQAAATLACSTETVRRLARSGDLEAIRLGRRGDYRIRPQSIGRLLDNETEEQ